MRHLDLFSGIGGFALAAEMVWDDVEHIFCDIEPFSQAVLKKHWPNATIYGDIRQLTTDPNSERELQQEGSVEDFRRWVGDGVDLLTGGFPCQPFSSAGRRKGTEDDRHLWPEMLRVIRETNPTWVIGENVRGLLTWDGGVVLDQVFADLEALGYEVGAFVIPACAVNAPHRRDRVWIVAHANGGADGRKPGEHASEGGEERLPERDAVREPSQPGAVHAPDPAGERLRKWGKDGTGEQPSVHPARVQPWSSEDWPTVAAQLCTLDDGLPGGLVRPRGWRNAALKAAGNAIVPQVAAEIMRAIASV